MRDSLRLFLDEAQKQILFAACRHRAGSRTLTSADEESRLPIVLYLDALLFDTQMALCLCGQRGHGD